MKLHNLFDGQVTRSFLLVMLVFFSGCTESKGEFKGRITAISDGDTVTALTGSNEQVKIRLSGIDCPERGQAWGQNAKKAISDHIFGQTIIIRPESTDRYGRLVANLFKDSESVSRYMVKMGHCMVYRRFATDQTLFALEDHAKANQLGLWSMPAGEIVEPWKFRQK